MTTKEVHKLLHPSKAQMLPFSVDKVLDNSMTDFDLYLDAAGQMTLYAKAPYRWSKEELSRLLAEGHGALFHSTADQQLADTYRALHHKVVIDESAPPAQRLLGLTDAAAELTRILYTQPLTQAAMGKVVDIAKAMVTCIQEDTSCVKALGKLADHDNYTYYHSARVSAYSLAIALHLSQRNVALLTELATGAILHDVGKSRIDLAVLNKTGAFTPQEWEQMKMHPVFGEAITADSVLGVVPRAVILHHHERLDGTGYPHQLSGHELLEEVKIAAFADVFDALTTNRPYQVSRTPFEALDFIRHKLLKNMHKDAFDAMVELLAAAPKASS